MPSTGALRIKRIKQKGLNSSQLPGDVVKPSFTKMSFLTCIRTVYQHQELIKLIKNIPPNAPRNKNFPNEGINPC